MRSNSSKYHDCMLAIINYHPVNSSDSDQLSCIIDDIITGSYNYQDQKDFNKKLECIFLT
jgi:hypothetical protein